MAPIGGHKIFVGHISSGTDSKDLRKVAETYGELKTMFYNGDDTNQHLGWAFVTFINREDGEKMIEELDNKFCFPGSRCPINVHWADGGHGHTKDRPKPTPKLPTSTPWREVFTPEGEPYYHNTLTDETQWERPAELNVVVGGARHDGPAGANLFVGQLPESWDDKELNQHFSPFGTIKNARVVLDEEGKSKCFGFVSYDNLHSASNAIETMHRFRVEGKSLSVSRKKGEETFGAPPSSYQSFFQPSHPYGGDKGKGKDFMDKGFMDKGFGGKDFGFKGGWGKW